MEAEISGLEPYAREGWNHQKLQVVRNGSSPENPQGDPGPAYILISVLAQ